MAAFAAAGPLAAVCRRHASAIGLWQRGAQSTNGDSQTLRFGHPCRSTSRLSRGTLAPATIFKNRHFAPRALGAGSSLSRQINKPKEKRSRRPKAGGFFFFENCSAPLPKLPVFRIVSGKAPVRCGAGVAASSRPPLGGLAAGRRSEPGAASRNGRRRQKGVTEIYDLASQRFLEQRKTPETARTRRKSSAAVRRVRPKWPSTK